MAGHTFFGKQKLCYTEVSDFTDYQGIGHDPMYKRYDSVFSIVRRVVPTSLHHFLATPEYITDADQICWHIDQWEEHPTRLMELNGPERDKYRRIMEDTIRQYKQGIMDLDGEDLQILAGAIKYIDEERVYCCDGKVFLVAWGMTPDTKQHKVIGSVIHEFDYITKHTLSFDAGDNGELASRICKTMTKMDGTTLTADDLPEVIPNEGWKFQGWSPNPIGQKVTSDMSFTATYVQFEAPVAPLVTPIIDTAEPEEDIFYNCTFDAGEHGTLEGANAVSKAANTTLSHNEIPIIKPHKGYTFAGWDVSPLNLLIDGDKVFVAQYEKAVSKRRRWAWLWWLLAILGSLLLTLLLLWLLGGCRGCLHHTPTNGIIPIDTYEGRGGRSIDDNGYVHPITDEEGNLPKDEERIVSPVIGENGEEPDIIEQPGMPNIMGDRLFLFMEDDNGDVDALARDFKKVYPGEEYSIIGFDREVKTLVIKIPSNQRDEVRKTINSKIPNHRFLVFDEEVYELNGDMTTTANTSDKGWHLEAIHLKQGWATTKGSPNVRVAIVDDGIQAGHPMFTGRIADAYNVYTQSNNLSTGEGHGTHTAGLAVGSAEFYSQGAAGVAPNCTLIPIQVFDNGNCPLSALVSGVMYAIHHNADVVNISIAPNFEGLNALPVEEQESIAESQFHNVEALWTRVCKIATRKKCILVFSAGNNDILTSIPPENRNESSIVVTSVDKRRYPTNFTNYGPCSDISAPGKDIYSSIPGGRFDFADGTSMSAPIVTGTIALMKSIKKDLTVEQARNILYSTGEEVYGWIPPMVLVDKAIEATKRGDFSRKERNFNSVPEDVDLHLHSGQRPVLPDNARRRDTYVNDNRNGDVIIEDEVVDSRDRTVVDGRNISAPERDRTIVEDRRGTTVDRNRGYQEPPCDETDYDAIRRLIEENKRKIKEIESQNRELERQLGNRKR